MQSTINGLSPAVLIAFILVLFIGLWLLDGDLQSPVG